MCGQSFRFSTGDLGRLSTDENSTMPHPSDPQYHPVCLLQKLKPLMADLKKVYAAPPEETALSELDSFDEKWSGKYPKIAKSWRDNRANLSTYFKYPEAVRRLIYTMNTIEGGTASFVK